MKDIEIYTASETDYPDMFELTDNPETGDRLIKDGMPFAVIKGFDGEAERLTISWLYPEALKGVDSHYEVIGMEKDNGENAIVLMRERKNIKQNKIIKESLDQDKKQKTFCFSPKELRAIVYDAANKIIKKHGLMDYKRCLKKVSLTQQAASGDLFSTKKK